MPTLAALQDPEVWQRFLQEVAQDSQHIEKQEIPINSGIRSARELTDRIRQGMTVPFDYDLLTEDVEQFV